MYFLVSLSHWDTRATGAIILEPTHSAFPQRVNQPAAETYSVDPDHPAFLSLLDGRPSTIRVKVETVFPRLSQPNQHHRTDPGTLTDMERTPCRPRGSPQSSSQTHAPPSTACS